jgi:hypothetical protein
MHPTARLALCSALAATALFGPAGASRPAQAQLPQPRLTGLSRLGARAGESVDVTLSGTDLERVETLWFDHPGLRAFHLKGTTFRIACAAGTPLGQHDVRVYGPLGVSNPRTFEVGDRPESVEAEPNDDPAHASPLAPGAVVNGGLTPTDVDCFAFEGRKGERVLLDLAAERLESRLDATIRVLDPSGREIAESRDVQGVDPLLDLTLPADGRYVVKVHDVIYGGSADHTYRLTLSNGPHLDAIVPAVAAPGTTGEFTLIGRGLGGTPTPGLAIDDRPLERKTVTISVPPAGGLDPAYPARAFLPSQAASRRGFEYALTLPSGTSNPLFLAEATDPVALEREPNDDAHAQAVTVPCDLSASFGALNDRDVFRFQAHKGEVWIIDASAERLGSPADPMFVVQRVVPKGPPQDLATAEDTPEQGAGARFGTASVDALLHWQAPEDGTYQVVATDLYGSQRGDPRLAYRLNIRPERPDFRLFLVPASPNRADALTLGAGGHAVAYAVAWRLDGYNGPIRVEPLSLPAGVRCAPVTIAAGQRLAPLVFEADTGAQPTVGTAVLVGRGRYGDRKEALHYVAGATPLGLDIAHEALGAGMIWPPANPQAPTVAPARVTRGFVVAVVEPAPLVLNATPASHVVAQGHLLDLALKVERRSGFTEAVAVAPSDVPANLGAATATIAKTADRGNLSLFVPANLAPGEYTFFLQGTGPYPFSKDPKAKTKPNVNLAVPSNAITLTVRPAPLGLSATARGGSVKQGASVAVEVTVSRRNGFADGLTLGLAAPEGLKLSAAPVTLGATETKATLVVRAAADSPTGAAAAVAVRAVATVRGEAIEVDAPLALTINK